DDRQVRPLDEDQLLMDLLATVQPVDGRPPHRPLDRRARRGGLLDREEHQGERDRVHSYLTAATGSMRAARRAGSQPATTLSSTKKMMLICLRSSMALSEL